MTTARHPLPCTESEDDEGIWREQQTNPHGHSRHAQMLAEAKWSNGLSGSAHSLLSVFLPPESCSPFSRLLELTPDSGGSFSLAASRAGLPVYC